jgi:hypothetical protein
MKLGFQPVNITAQLYGNAVQRSALQDGVVVHLPLVRAVFPVFYVGQLRRSAE